MASSDIVFKIDADTEEGQKHLQSLEDHFKGVQGAAKNTEIAINAFSNVLSGIGKIATGAAGMVMAVLKAPADLDTYLGSLNQKITVFDGQLNKYKSIYTEFLHNKDFAVFKPGEGGFGLSDEDYQKVMKQFTTGASVIEKYGASARSNITGMTQGAGMMMKQLGFDPTVSASLMVDLHKTIGLTYDKMEPFAQSLGTIGKSANMSTAQMAALIGQVSSLSKAYGMGSDQAQRYVKESFAVGAALSQVGLNATDMIAKMNEVSTGSEEGLIQSLLLGFQPGDAKGQLEAFQRQASMIVSMAQGAGAQMMPFIMRQMGNAMGMGNVSVEQMQRLAKGGMMEGPEGAAQKDPAAMLKDIMADQAKLLGRDGPFVTAAQESNQLQNTARAQMIEHFDGAFQQLKGFLLKLPEYIDKAFAFFDSVLHHFGDFSLSLTHIAEIAAGLVALKVFGPSILSAIIVGALKGIGGLLGGVAGGAAGSMAGMGGMALAAAGLVPIAGAILLGLLAAGAVTLLWEAFATEKTKRALGDTLMKLTGTDSGISTSWLELVDKSGKTNRQMMIDKYGADTFKEYPTMMGDAGEDTDTQIMKYAMDKGDYKPTAQQLASDDPSGLNNANGIEKFWNKLTSGLSPDKAGSSGLMEWGKAHGMKGSQTNPMDHVPGSLHNAGYAVDIPVKVDKAGNPLSDSYKKDIADAESHGWRVLNEIKRPPGETEWNGPHLHVEDRVGYAASLSQKGSPTSWVGQLLDVHDREANATLHDIRGYLAQVLHQQPAIAGSTSPADSTGVDFYHSIGDNTAQWMQPAGFTNEYTGQK